MAKILTTGEVLDLWCKVREKASKADRAIMVSHIARLEGAMTDIGSLLAEILGVRSGAAELEGEDFCGLAVSFIPTVDGDPCPEDLKEFDEGADWGDEPLEEGGD